MSKKNIIIVTILGFIMCFTFYGLILFNNVLPNRFKGLSASSNVYFICDKTNVNINDVVSCKIYLNAVDGQVSSFAGNISLTNNLSLVSSEYSSNWSQYSSASNGKFMLSSANLQNGNIQIGTFSFKVNSGDKNTTSRINLSSVVVGDENYNEMELGSALANLSILSNDNNLSNISIDNGTLSPAFSPSITTYSVNTISSSITINATPAAYGTVSGTGIKQLQYGNNKFEIVSKAENGKSKTYIINVIRDDNRSSDNNLKSLSVSNTNIKYDGSLFYSYTVENEVKEVEIKASLKDNKSTIDGLGIKSLRVGKNDFNIVVTAENGSKKTYVITILRKDKEGNVSLSEDNYIKSLNIEGISFDFNKNTLKYNFIVENSVDKLNINYVLSDSKASIKISNTDLIIGNNTIKLVVTAENGKTRTYIINVTRKNAEVFVSNISNDILDKIYDENSKEDIVVSVNNSKEKYVSSEILSALKKTKKVLKYNVCDDNQMVLYSVIIDGNKLNNTKQFNYELKIEKINKEYNNYTTLKLTTKDEIPGVIEYSINTNLLFKQLDSYNYYKIVNNKYELINDKVVSIDNYISLNISDNNVYVLSDKIIKNNINIIIIIIIIISIVFIAILGFIIYYFIKKKTKTGIKFYKFKRINIS